MFAEMKEELEETSDNLRVTSSKLHRMTDDWNEQKHLVGVDVNTEHNLHSQASQVRFILKTRILCVL